MAYMLVRHKVEHFKKWKELFDAHVRDRKKAEIKDG